jgi:hypothetical protein
MRRFEAPRASHGASSICSMARTGRCSATKPIARSSRLVRPDGYVGAIVASARIEALEMYFQQCGLG